LVSPYINRFLQPDSIIPNPLNPQSYNRYSYVTNRPVNFNDPTGHTYLCDEDCEDESEPSGLHAPVLQGDGGEDDEIEKRYRKIGRLKAMLPIIGAWGWECDQTYKECLYSRDLLTLQSDQQIDMNQMIELMTAVYYDLKHQSLGLRPLAKGDEDIYRFFYDTPFWNGVDVTGQPRDDTRICLGNNCYRRSDVNYFAQGMWGAASGESLVETVQVAADYKFEQFHESLSPSTEYWITVGYNVYNSLDSIYGGAIENGSFEEYFNN
jgi:hypothetical protein